MLLMGLLIDWPQLRKESEFEEISTEYSKTKKQREKNWGIKKINKNRISKDCGTTTKGITYV